MKLKNKKILLIIGGGIAAYKSLDLIRLLKKNDFQVKTILTKSGKEFVTPLSLVSLSGNKVYEKTFDLDNEAEMDHITLSRWADLIIVLPATANFMSKLVIGKAEDLATTVLLASDKEIILVPAMNVRMWINPATKKNVSLLLDYGYKFLGPVEGEMACGEYGEGKMSSPRQIHTFINNYFKDKDYIKNKKIKALVTTGATREYFDPVRYISNESSGKQGYEIALALSKLGVRTTLIAGPSSIKFSKEIKIIKVINANQMMREVKTFLPTDIAVCAAAVSDFKPKKKFDKKIKKKNIKNNFFVELEKNLDILGYIGKSNKNRPKLVVGFSAETENIIENSKKKLEEKFLDMIIANDVSRKDIGFNSDYNQVAIINKNNKVEKISKNKKNFIAKIIAKKIVDKFLIDDKNIH